MSRVSRILLQSTLWVCLLSLCVACGGPESDDDTPSTTGGAKKNIVLISIDSLRRDRVGAYGHKPVYAPEVPVSPNLDALAADGVVFEDAWTTTSWTLPSHMALMTGLSDRRHGVENDFFRLDPLRRTMAQNLQDAGWNTAGYFSGPYLDSKYGFGRGFDDYRSGMISAEEFAAEIAAEQDRRVAQGKPEFTPQDIKRFFDRKSHIDITSPRINELGIKFLDQQDGDEPFFLFLHYFDAHYDHIPWRMDAVAEGVDWGWGDGVGLAQRFDPGYTKTLEDGGFDGSNWYFDQRVMGPGPEYQRRIGERDLEHIKAFYDAEIHWVDYHVGQIIAHLKAKGMWEDTILMVIADHGDEFFDHKSIGHRSTLYAEQCRIPMILRVPGETPAGRRVETISRIYDGAPTLLDFAGAPPLKEAEGASLRTTIDGTETSRYALQRIYSRGHKTSNSLNVRDGWRNERYTVMRLFRYDEANSTDELLAVYPYQIRATGEPYWVFDRKVDPEEKSPLRPGNPRYEEAVAQFTRDFMESEKGAMALPVSPPSERNAPPFSGAELAAMEALGYVDGESGEDDGPSDDSVRPLAPFPAPKR
ncbi:MAG: sulfatase [Planctomycetota bacterium]